MMRALLLLSFFFGAVPSFALTVNKCCSLSEIYDFVNNTCEPYENTHDLRWFPITALYDMETKTPLGAEGQAKMIRWLSEPGTVVHENGSYQRHSHIFFAHKPGSAELDGYKIFVASHDDIQVFLSVDPGSEDNEEPHTLTLDPAFMVPIEDLCFDVTRSGTYMAMFIHSKIMIQKCCGYGEMFSHENNTCIENLPSIGLDDWRPDDIGGLDLGVPPSDFSLCQDYFMYHSADDYFCRGFIEVRAPPIFFLNGSVLLSSDSAHPELLDAHTFCSEATLEPAGTIRKNIIICREPQEPQANLDTLYGVLFLLGGFVLMVTVAVSLYLPQLRQRLHNRIAITHNVSLMIAHFAWGPQFFHNEERSSSGCSIRALIVQYTFLASLFWLNVFCVNLSSTFRYNRILSSRSVKSDNRRYFGYSLYAWGTPVIISIFTIAMEFSESNPLGIVRPGFTCYCDYAAGLSRFIYLYGPMSVILLLNLVLYVATTWKIISVHRQTAPILKRMESSSTGGAVAQTDHQKLALYTKLFVVMGVTWSLDIITWLADIGDTYFSVFCDVLNILRPVFIFVIFICKKSVLVSLRGHLLGSTGKYDSERSTATENISMGGVTSRKASAYEDCSGRKKSGEVGSVHEMLVRAPSVQ